MPEPNTAAFSRTEMLIGTENMKRLYASCILVFGAGGVGSHCIEALARSGVGTLILVDSDVVSLTNINRQSIAFYSTVGRYKTELLKEKIRDIHPDCRVITRETFVLPDNLENLMEEIFKACGKVPDYIIDAIDTVSTKLALAEYAWTHHIPIISSMGTGNKLHPELFAVEDIYKTAVCPLCRVIRRELKKRQIPALKVLYSRETPLTPQKVDARKILPGQPKNENCQDEFLSISPENESLPGETSSRRAVPGSISFVPPVAGLMIAGEVIRSICEGLGCKNSHTSASMDARA